MYHYGFRGRCIAKKLSINKIESIMAENDLCDIWKLQNENTRQYTWRFFNPLVHRPTSKVVLSIMVIQQVILSLFIR